MRSWTPCSLPFSPHLHCSLFTRQALPVQCTAWFSLLIDPDPYNYISFKRSSELWGKSKWNKSEVAVGQGGVCVLSGMVWVGQVGAVSRGRNSECWPGGGRGLARARNREWQTWAQRGQGRCRAEGVTRTLASLRETGCPGGLDRGLKGHHVAALRTDSRGKCRGGGAGGETLPWSGPE